jgi:hypothetical protein
MGFVVFLLIAAIIIVVIVVVKSKKRKEIFEELKNHFSYELAVKVKEELEKKMGYDFGGPYMDVNNGYAYGSFLFNPHPYLKPLNICFSKYNEGLDGKRQWYKQNKKYNVNCIYGIENEKVFLLVYEESKGHPFENVPEDIKIAAEVIEKNGYGPCREIRI